MKKNIFNLLTISANLHDNEANKDSCIARIIYV
jgi:hypothetical protein